MPQDPDDRFSGRPTRSPPGVTPNPSSSLTRPQNESESSLKDKAMGAMKRSADDRKDVVTGQMRGVSSAISAAADDFDQRDDVPSWMADGVRSLGSGLGRFADSVKGKDSAALLKDVRDFATARPLLFLGACAAAGIVATRIAGAGATPAARR